MRKTLIVFTAMLIAFQFAGCKKEKPEQKDKGHKCAFCKMMVKLPDNAQGAKIVFKDGREEYYCVMAHAIKGWTLETGPEADPDNPPVKFLAVDYGKKELVDARKATFVLGSDVSASMLEKSVVAFGNKNDAEKFAGDHGGEILDFDKLAASDFADMKHQKNH